MGGVYERLVGLVKRCLRKSLDRLHLKSDKLATVFIEVEAITNSRPLVTRGSLVSLGPLVRSRVRASHFGASTSAPPTSAP